MDGIELIELPGNRALDELLRLRAEYKTTGWYPLMLGSADQVKVLEESREYTFGNGEDPQRILAESRKIDIAQWLNSNVVNLELHPDDVGPWPDEPPPRIEIMAHTDIRTGEYLPQVTIGLLKVAAPWEIFAYLAYGGWNDCPPAEVQCAMHRHWLELYGAEVASVAEDVVQSIVARPPRDRSASMSLAREQYIYCNDIVGQGVGSISALGANLLRSPYWFFWWD